MAEPATSPSVQPFLLRQFARLDRLEISGLLCVVLLWALMAFPAVAIRGTHYEEGTVIALARGALEDGHWLAPFRYGIRFAERPVLLSWIAAAVGALTGGVSVWSARLPHLLFLLGGGLMVFSLVRSQAGKAPAIFGAMCWFACPMVAQKFITAEPDVTLSVCMFGAFVIWWRGVATGGPTFPRWIAAGFVLAIAGLVKGPQPLGYFTLGIGAYIILKKRWHDLPGLIATNAIAIIPSVAWYWAVIQPGDVVQWMHHSRINDGTEGMRWVHSHADFAVSLIFEWLPGSILLVPAAALLFKTATDRDDSLTLAVLLYAIAGSLVLNVWPGGVASRYAMPANLALAVLCGLMFETWRLSRPWLITIALGVAAAIASYLVLIGWIAMPLAPDVFRKSRIAAQEIEAVRKIVPGPLYAGEGSANYNTLAYIAAPVRVLTPDQFAALTTPSLAVLNADEVSALAARKPDIKIILHALIRDNTMTQAVEIRP